MTGELSRRGRGRRRVVGATIVSPLVVGWPAIASAGTQAEEPLADAVRTALAAAVADSAPPKPSFTNIDERLAYLRWLGAMSDRLRKQKTELVTRVEFLQTLWYETRRAGLEPARQVGGPLMVANAGARGMSHEIE